MNSIQTWQQGEFVNLRKYKDIPKEWKEKSKYEESFLVRPSAVDNAICKATTPENSKWIAERLNKCARLEQLIDDLKVRYPYDNLLN